MDDMSFSKEDSELLESPASPLCRSTLLLDSDLDEPAPPTPPRRTMLPDLGGEHDSDLPEYRA
jgi:hypothetical protein